MHVELPRPHRGHFADPSSPVILAPGRDLSLQDVVAVARGDGCGRYAPVELAGSWEAECTRSAEAVRRAVEATRGRTRDELAQLTRNRLGPKAPTDPECAATRAMIYGVTTGFGTFKSRALDSAEALHQMQINILRSHAVGVGAPMPTEVVRAMMLLRLRTFLAGYSGVRPTIVKFLADLLNCRVHPWVPQQGSVGSSGDLCPQAHLSLIFIGEGLAWLGDDEFGSGGSSPVAFRDDPRGERRPAPLPARDVLARAGLADRLFDRLEPKEGLALTNGTAATTALAALAVYDADVLYGSTNLAASLSIQALCGFTRALDPKVNRLRRHAGQADAAAQILEFVRGGSLVDRSDDVQDAYSLRCAPAVHGAAWTAIDHAWSLIENEINAVTDNPLFFDAGREGPPCDAYAACIWDAYSAGNFHGEPIGMAADYLKIAVAELAAISERRTQCLLDENHNRGLPANLWHDPHTAGLHSGLMIAQYAAASLVSENKVLAHPAGVDSIPTSSNVEDHVAMATIAARHARLVNENASHVVAIEILAALQALDIRQKEHAVPPEALLSDSARAVRTAVRTGTADVARIDSLFDGDRVLWPDISALRQALIAGHLLRLALHPIGRP